MTKTSKPQPLLTTSITSLPLLHRGKVRDIYDIDADTMLLIATDRLSAFDVILPTPIAGKGVILTEIANFWFEKLKHVVPNHLTGIDPDLVVSDVAEKAQLGKRALVVLNFSSEPRPWTVPTDLQPTGQPWLNNYPTLAAGPALALQPWQAVVLPLK